MTLEEIINHIEELANSTNNNEYNRLLELLKELRAYRNIGSVEELMDRYI